MEKRTTTRPRPRSRRRRDMRCRSRPEALLGGRQADLFLGGETPREARLREVLAALARRATP